MKLLQLFRVTTALALMALLLPSAAVAQAAPAAPKLQPWVEKSNQNTKIVNEVVARFGPEGAGQLGIEGLDEQIVDLKPNIVERTRAATREVLAELKKRHAAEKGPLVKQDLEILIQGAEDNIRNADINEKYYVPYNNVTRLVFGGLRALLDDQIAPSRRQAAVVRLRKYAGLDPGYEPITKLAMDRTREGKRPGLLGPPKEQVEQDLSRNPFFVDGIAKLLEKYKIEGWQEPYAKLKEQLAEYDKFIRAEILPIARTDFRLPPEDYAFNLHQYGVDIPPQELAKRAHAAFDQLQKEMQTIAADVAKERGFASADYRDVIRELKKKQLIGEAILPHYKERLAEIEKVIARERLVTLPARPARIRIATEAESAASPAPNMRPPRLIGNTGEQGEFVLPLNFPGKEGEIKRYDDFTYEAVSWTLTAHEARPGHELQFAAMVEAGVSQARAVYAFNSTNVEGWGLYAESILLPYMPKEGQLVSLQARLMRAARAYLDPELQAGKVTPEQALAVLKTDVVLSDAMATQEVERYTFRAPGQATSYFYGYTRLQDLRKEVEAKLGKKFDRQKFHDFILNQGLLPPDLLRKAVLAEFVGGKEKASR